MTSQNSPDQTPEKITAEQICRDHPSGTVHILITDQPDGGPATASANGTNTRYPARERNGAVTAVVQGFILDGRQVRLATSRGVLAPVSLSRKFLLAAAPTALPPLTLGVAEAVLELNTLASQFTRTGHTQLAAGCRLLAHHADAAVVAAHEIPRQLRAMAADGHARPLLDRTADTLTRTLGIPVHVTNLRPGDVVTLPGETRSRVLRANNWVSSLNVHQLMFGQDQTRCYPTADAPDVILHERPDAGPLDAVYQVGARVKAWWCGRWELGRVAEVIPLPDPKHPADACYVIEKPYTRPEEGPAVGVENLRPETTPDPAVGQVWTSTDGRHTCTVVGVEPGCAGLIAVNGNGTKLLLASPHWQLAKDVPADDDAVLPAARPAGQQLDLLAGVPGWGDLAEGLGIATNP